MTYTEAKLFKQKLDEKNDIDSNRLKSFEKNSMGITPDHIRETSEWKFAEMEFNKSFAELRNFNGWFVKAFKKEIQADRRNRYKRK